MVRLDRTTLGHSTDLLQPEDHRDILLGADGQQVVGQQLSGGQELVIAALVNQNIQSGARVGGSQDGGIVGLREKRWDFSFRDPWDADVTHQGALTSQVALSEPR